MSKNSNYSGLFIGLGAIIGYVIAIIELTILRYSGADVHIYLLPTIIGACVGYGFYNLLNKIHNLIHENKILRNKLKQHHENIKGVPICSYCKKIRNTDSDDDNSKEHWISIEEFLYNIGVTNLTHSICPECLETQYADMNLRISELLETDVAESN